MATTTPIPADAATSPPPTDAGSVPNLRFSFADAHRRVEDGGWAREVTQRELPVATTLAGVNMALEPGAVRELHWHTQAEWAYMLAGRGPPPPPRAGAPHTWGAPDQDPRGLRGGAPTFPPAEAPRAPAPERPA